MVGGVEDDDDDDDDSVGDAEGGVDDEEALVGLDEYAELEPDDSFFDGLTGSDSVAVAAVLVRTALLTTPVPFVYTFFCNGGEGTRTGASVDEDIGMFPVDDHKILKHVTTAKMREKRMNNEWN